MNVVDVLPRDAIPGIDDPEFGPEYFGDPDDEVIVVEADPPRAYPIRILSYHEIVNDVLEETDSSGENTSKSSGERRPIAVTWCPICANAVVYDRTVDDRVLTFGTSGKLADDALVMYDRETGSEWKQPLGRAIDGPLESRELTIVSATVTSWERVRAEYPDGIMLQPIHGGENDPRGKSPRAAYDMARYEQYDVSEEFGLRSMRGAGRERSWDRGDIDAKTPVPGVVHGGEAVGYPASEIRSAGGVVTDSVGGLEIVAVSDDTGLHAFENPGYDFEMRDGTLYGDGVPWDPTTGQSGDGCRLPRVPSRRLYAFAWQDDHGPESFYGLD